MTHSVPSYLQCHSVDHWSWHRILYRRHCVSGRLDDGRERCVPELGRADWIRDEAVRIGSADPDKEVALADLAGHPVTTACWISEYVDLLPVAEAYGLPLDGIPDVEVRENSFGLFMANAETVSYGEFGLHDVDQDAVYAMKCVSGTDLVLVFDSITPLAGGRVVERQATIE